MVSFYPTLGQVIVYRGGDGRHLGGVSIFYFLERGGTKITLILGREYENDVR